MTNDLPAFSIRMRHRQGYIKEAGGYVAWTEWQVVQGRRVISRHDTELQAIKNKLKLEDIAFANMGAME